MKNIITTFLLTVVLLFGSRATSLAQTNLIAGDIAFIGLYMDGLSTSGDGFTFILLKNLDAGTVVYFTDEGWDASPNNTWYGNTNDAHISWTVSAGGLPIGTIVHIENTTTTTFSTTSGTVSGTLAGVWNLASSGDQMLAYQSSTGARPASPVFITAIDADYYIGSTYDGLDGWGSSYYSQPYCSYLPVGLTNNSNCLALVNGTTAVTGGFAVGYECDNYKYIGTLTGTVDEIRLAISTISNWIGNEDGSTNIAIGAYPTPNITAPSTPPTVTTQAVSSIATTTATGNGNITSLGVPNPTAHGVCWNTTGTPTTANSNVNNGAASATGAFTASMTSLSANTTYYVRAYATNSGGTNYGTEVSFTTLPLAPTVTTQAVSSIASTTATGNGNITSLGVPNPTAHGVCWNTTGTPTTSNSNVNNGAASATGAFTASITSLSPNTTYYVRAYATNSAGTSYGSEVSFTTLPLAPTVTTQAVSSIASTTATGNGNITSLGVPNPTAHGVCWNTTGTPTTANSNVNNGAASATGAFTASITSLSPNTTYYVRAYATNTAGTSYGSEVSFTTLPLAPTVTTQAVSSIASTTATGNGNITNLGVPNPTAHGVCWNTTGTPTTANSNVNNGAASATGAFTASITSLSPNTTYYVRAYATNTAGTCYGSEVSFTTSAVAPTVTTQAVSSIASTTATGNGNITNLGVPNPTAHGVCWNTTGTPTTSNSNVNNGAASATGAFTASITSLSPNTTYYVRAYATNTAGTSYGSEVSFTTSAVAPTVTTQAVSSIASTTATGNGNITSLGVPNPTAHGVCWNTTGTPTTSNSNVNNGAASATGAFTASITSLSPNTTYYVRAYATNSAGTSYGSEVSFTTLPLAPTVTTQAVSSIATTTATGNGNITNLGVPNPTAHGVCWNTTGTPTTANNNVNNGAASATGAFTASITSLSPNTTYYVRAYATNTAGTSYGSEVSFTTSKIQLNITDPIILSKEYDGTIDASSYTTIGTVSGIEGGDIVLVSIASSVYDNKNIGSGKTVTVTYSISGADMAKYNAPATSVVSTGQITAKDITVNVDALQSKVYGGTDPSFTYSNTPALFSGDAFTGTLSREIGENIGFYTINQGTLSAGSNYAISFNSEDFEITTKPIIVSVDPFQSKIYGDADPIFTFTTTPALVFGDSYTGSLTRELGEDVDSYEILQGSLSAGSNYTINYNSDDFEITAKNITVTTDANQTKVYGDADPEITYSVLPALISGDTFTGSLQRIIGEDAGFYAISQGTLSAGLNYNINFIPENFEILAKDILVTVDAGQTKVYGGTDPEFIYTCAPSLIFGDVFSGTLERAMGENVGFYEISQGTLNVGTNYNLSFVSNDFEITAKEITVTADASQTKYYTEIDPVFTFTVLPALESGDSFTGALSRVIGENAGLYAIEQGSLSAGTNYTIGFVSNDFEILPIPIAVTVDAGQTKVYGQTDPEFTYTFNPALESGDSFTGMLSREAGEDAGFYEILQGDLTAGNNYQIIYNSDDFEITAIDITVTANALQTKVYGEPDPELTYTVSPDLNSGDSFTGLLNRAVGEDVGTYAIEQGTLSAGVNYTMSFVAADFEITVRDIIVTADESQTKQYGDSDPIFTYSVAPTLYFSDELTGELSRASGESIGFYAIELGTLGASDNYNLSFISSDFEITTKALNITGLVAENKVYDANVTAAVSGGLLDGIVGLDDVSATMPTNGVFEDQNIGTNKVVSIDEIVLQGEDATNYTIIQPIGLTANITAKELFITGSFTVNNKQYDETTVATISSNNLVLNGIISDEIVELNPVAEFATAEVGDNIVVSLTSATTISGINSGNYTLSLVDAPTTTASILPVNIDLANDDIQSVYPNPFANYICLSNSENVKNITITDVNGKQICSMDFNGEQNINTENLEAGVYFITVKLNSNETLIYKMVKF